MQSATDRHHGHVFCSGSDFRYKNGEIKPAALSKNSLFLNVAHEQQSAIGIKKEKRAEQNPNDMPKRKPLRRSCISSSLCPPRTRQCSEEKNLVLPLPPSHAAVFRGEKKKKKAHTPTGAP
jgi:hypothetical protein